MSKPFFTLFTAICGAFIGLAITTDYRVALITGGFSGVGALAFRNVLE